MKYAFIRAHRVEFGIRALRRVLRVHFSGFHAWLKEPLSHRAQEDAPQTELVRQAWTDSGKVHGYRKLTDDLRDQGESISENRVAPFGVTGRDRCADRLQAPPRPIWRQACCRR